jgi:mannosyltransferase OCH1-like enzyme
MHADAGEFALAGDALRPFLLYHFGGVYLDLDCECFRPMNAWIKKYDLVLQSEYSTERVRPLSNFRCFPPPVVPP